MTRTTDPASEQPGHSYAIPCPAAFREAVEGLAARRNVTVGEIARAVLLLVPEGVLAGHPDPGDAADEAEGEAPRRRPRLQLRMMAGLEHGLIRQALALALALDCGDLESLQGLPGRPVNRPPSLARTGNPELDDSIERLRTVVSVLAFIPLPNGVTSRSEALHVLGFPPESNPDRNTIRAKFRMLATIHHPDSEYGSHLRMAQLNAAMAMLRRS